MKHSSANSYFLSGLFAGFVLLSSGVKAQTNYFSKTGNPDLSLVASWTTNPTGGGGGSPANFTTASQIFHITANNGSVIHTIANNWTVSGSGSYIVIGSGSTPVTFTIPAAYQVTGPIDSINANAVLTIMNAPSLTSIVWTATKAVPTSTIDYLNLGSVTTVPVSFTYGNVIFDGTKFANTASGTFSLEGNFTIQNTSGTIAGFVPVQTAGTSGVSLNLLGSLNQILTGNGHEFHCYTFIDTSKTNGNVTFMPNTPLNMYNHMCLKQASVTNQIYDGGNSDSVFNNINMGGIASAYNLTGTIVLDATSGGTQKISNNYSLPDPSAIIGAMNNLTVDGAITVNFYTNTTRQNITIKGNFLVLAAASPINLVTTSPTSGIDSFFIGGNYTNNSTTLPTFNPQTVYVFNGASPQTMSSSTGGEIFTNLEIDNPSGVTLNSQFTVSGVLTLTNGLLNTATGRVLALGTAASTPGGSNISYVNGPMVKKGNTAFEFPVGGGGWFAPIGISAPTTATNLITAEFFNATPINPTSFNSPLTNVSVLEYWTLSESVSTDVISNVTLYWQNGPLSGIYNYTTPDLQVADYITSGSTWNDLGGTSVSGTFPGAGNITSSSSITGFTNLPITFGSTNVSINPLPITLTDFTATYIQESNSVQVDWIVASQLNNKEFVIEKTLDGINYTEVATVPGAGTTPFSQSYSAIDNNPSTGISYYRLRQIDMDGNPTDFSPVSIMVGNNLVFSASLYPNPVVESAILNYKAENNEPVAVSIFDITGKEVSSNFFGQVVAGENNFNLNTSGLSRGIYFMQITNGQKAFSLRFIKQ
jgi:hypothetical protein